MGLIEEMQKSECRSQIEPCGHSAFSILHSAFGPPSLAQRDNAPWKRGNRFQRQTVSNVLYFSDMLSSQLISKRTLLPPEFASVDACASTLVCPAPTFARRREASSLEAPS